MSSPTHIHYCVNGVGFPEDGFALCACAAACIKRGRAWALDGVCSEIEELIESLLERGGGGESAEVFTARKFGSKILN